MSYSLHDSQGNHVGQVASVGGMNDLLDFTARIGAWGPLNDFLNSGKTSNIPGVMQEISQFAPYATDANVRDTLQNLKQQLEKVKGSAIIVD